MLAAGFSSTMSSRRSARAAARVSLVCGRTVGGSWDSDEIARSWATCGISSRRRSTRLPRKLRGDEEGDTRDVAARPVQTGDQASA